MTWFPDQMNKCNLRLSGCIYQMNQLGQHEENLFAIPLANVLQLYERLPISFATSKWWRCLTKKGHFEALVHRCEGLEGNFNCVCRCDGFSNEDIFTPEMAIEVSGFGFLISTFPNQKKPKGLVTRKFLVVPSNLERVA